MWKARGSGSLENAQLKACACGPMNVTGKK